MDSEQLAKAKNTAANFEKMVEDRPAEAIKYVRDFEKNPFWQYFKAKIQIELDASDEQLRTCALEDVQWIRGYRAGIEYRIEVPERLVDELKDNIAVQKEAAKVEEARQQEEK